MKKTLCIVALSVSLALVFASPLSAQNFQIESFQGRDVIAGEILVRFRGGTEAQSMAVAAQDADIASAEPVGQSGAMLLRSRNRDVTALVQAYSSRLDVVYAEPNHIWRASDFPNDPLFGQQWGVRNTGQAIVGLTGTAGADIKALQAWDITEGSRAIVVGVVDSGVDYTHPDLAGNMWSAPTAFTVRIAGQTITCAAGTHGFNGVTRTCDPRDDFGHGTHVAGILGASGNNGTGVSGVSRVASIMALKFLGSNGNGSTMDAVAALDFVIQVKALFPAAANVRVLNNSWGGGAFSQTLLDEINLLNSNDILFVTSAGNSATINDLTPIYPTNYDAPNVLSVAATDNRDALASFSHWGPTTVDLGAPGVNVLSTMPAGLYGFNSGTSMAAPMVSGAAALVLSACQMTTAAVKSNLMGSVDEIPALAERTLSGGRLNVFRALTACASAPAPTFMLTVTPGAQNVDLNASTNFTVTSTALRGFSGAVDLRTSGLPAGITAAFSPSFIQGGSGSSTLTVSASAIVVPGMYMVGITGTSGSVERRSGVSIAAGPLVNPIGLGQTISGTLSPTDRISQGQSGSYADFYTLTLNARTAVSVDLKSTLFDAFLYVLSPSGTILLSNDNIDGPNSRISATLNAGTYLIEATSADRLGGRFTLSVNTPTLATIVPRMAPPGTASNVTITGTRFVSPMTIDAGSGITVSNVNVTSETSATATLTIAADAAPGPRNLTVTTSEGTSNPMMYPIPTGIATGQKISGSVSVTDLSWPNTLFKYTDLYQFNFASNLPGLVTIDVRSTGFDSILGLFSAGGVALASSNNTGGPNNDRITTTLISGTYFMEVTSLVPQATGDYILSVHLPGLTTITPRFLEQGSSSAVTLTGSRFASPITISAGTDILASNLNVVSPTSATAILAVSADATLGDREITAGTPVGSTNAVTLRVVPTIPSTSLGRTISGTLSTTDQPSLDVPDTYMDLYRFTLESNTRVTVTLESTAFDTNLFLLNASGAIAFANNDSAGNRNSRITLTLAAGTYFIEATSFLDGQVGDYTLSLNLAAVSLIAISPRFGGQSSTVNVSLLGTGFVEGMAITAGAGITVSNVTVTSSTLATATFTIAANAVVGVRDVTATTSEGASSVMGFTVYAIATITLGETRSGGLSLTDLAAPSRAGNYGDLYRLTLSAPTPVAIDVRSTAFNAFINVLSASGVVLFSDDQSGGSGNARIAATLAAGAYFIEVTSSTPGIGDYTVTAVFNPTTLNFPRAFSPSDLVLTGFAIVNPGSTAAAVKFTLYDESGIAVGSSNETVVAKGQFAKLGTEIFPGASRTGWVQATSDTVGLQAFWMGGDFISAMDGAEAAPEAVELVFPLITPLTELNIANLGAGTNPVTISINGPTPGTPAGIGTAALLATATRTIPVNGVFKSTLAGLFPSVNLNNAMSIRVVGTHRMTGTTVTSDFPLGPSMSVVNGVNASITATQASFPHVISGSQAGGASWTSILGITNLSTTLGQTVTITFTPNSGSPVSVTRLLLPRGAVRQDVQTIFSFAAGYQDGWVRVTGTAPLNAYIAYGFSGTSGAAVVPAQSTSRSSMIFAHVANGPAWSTGLALLNATTTDANVQVYIVRKTGALVGSQSFVLPAGTKQAKLLTELVPLSNADDGFVFVRTTNNVLLYGVQLFFSHDQKVIANVAAGALDSTITYTPPLPTIALAEEYPEGSRP